MAAMSPTEIVAHTPMILGVTASGKTELSRQIAATEPRIEVISIDSRQIYKLLSIGTAKPPQSLLEEIPHHLIDILTPDQSYSAGQFVRDATTALVDIVTRGSIPLFVGGTGFYASALFQPLSAPPVDRAVLSELQKQREEHGLQPLVDQLVSVDPSICNTIDLANSEKVLRALACWKQTGCPYSSFQDKENSTTTFNPNVLVMMPDAETTNQRIESRSEQMVSDGLVEELRTVLAQGYLPDAPGLRTVGYRETLDYLNGSLNRTELRDQIVIATRQYAKRQRTWFRNKLDWGVDRVVVSDIGEGLRWWHERIAPRLRF